ncbi:hypothetical protein RFI_08262 [Reticulomyxa filosa]|uniref:Ricin B lectin domain-containing protein n=1 Tax=Reticulomyxa filosa TaxID=46433 RepID=X6NSZ6_RETFI|nr:hypothetical protein RFI_08262 [Reticulomyxa filosa]|eukprot:ETO28864.1 hypothetical protein RFI_08262 [Reticulomyxa filosa]
MGKLSALYLFFQVSSIWMLSVLGSSCNYVRFDARLEFGVFGSDLGTFSLATERCQALRTTINFLETTTIEGSSMFRCVPGNTSQVHIQIYSDLYCEKLIFDYISLFLFLLKLFFFLNCQKTPRLLDDKATPNRAFTLDPSSILSYVQLNVSEIKCGGTDCYVSNTLAQNCSWGTESSYYLNISTPMGQCLTLGTNIGNDLMYLDFIPTEVASWFNSNSVRTACCQQTNDLIILNYTNDGFCQADSLSTHSNYLVGSTFNQKCMSYDDTTTQQLWFLEWECGDSNTVNCDDVKTNSLDDLMPQLCADECQLIHSDTNKDSGFLSNMSKTVAVTLAVVLIVIFFLILGCIFFLTRRNRRRRDREMRAAGAITGESKYEPMVEASDIHGDHVTHNISDLFTTTAFTHQDADAAFDAEDPSADDPVQYSGAQ